MGGTRPSEIVLTIQAVKHMQAELKSLATVVEAIGERLGQVEVRLDLPDDDTDRGVR